jgi:hypothetical protein
MENLIPVPSKALSWRRAGNICTQDSKRLDLRPLPIYLLTNLDTALEAVEAYRKRFLIETLFSDIKSRGFDFDKTRLKEPKKAHRLRIAVALAYIWILWLEKKQSKTPSIERSCIVVTVRIGVVFASGMNSFRNIIVQS